MKLEKDFNKLETDYIIVSLLRFFFIKNNHMDEDKIIVTHGGYWDCSVQKWESVGIRGRQIAPEISTHAWWSPKY